MFPKPYIEFLEHFHGDRDYFECHEILEEYWKHSDDRTKDSIWVGLILLSVSTYHHRRNNFQGAKRTLEKAIKIFESETSTNLGLDKGCFSHLLAGRLIAISKKESYTSFNLPINDPDLLAVCHQMCKQKGVIWGQKSDLTNASLVHRHKLRDRTGVIEERFQSINAKKSSK